MVRVPTQPGSFHPIPDMTLHTMLHPRWREFQHSVRMLRFSWFASVERSKFVSKAREDELVALNLHNPQATKQPTWNPHDDRFE